MKHLETVRLARKWPTEGAQGRRESLKAMPNKIVMATIHESIHPPDKQEKKLQWCIGTDTTPSIRSKQGSETISREKSNLKKKACKW